MKMNRLTLACGVALMGASAIAQAEFSANVGVTSNYVWRGVTQTMDDPAVQGGIDYAHENGFYAGIWASNVDFGTSGEEVDLYAGFSGEAGTLGYDLGLIHYAYPSHNDSDFTEIYGSLSFSAFTAGLAYTIDTEAGGDDEHLYYHAGASMDLPDDWSIGLTVGHYDFDGGSSSDYSHAQLDIGKSAGDFGDFTLSASIAEEESGDDDPIVFVSWGKSF